MPQNRNTAGKRASASRQRARHVRLITEPRHLFALIPQIRETEKGEAIFEVQIAADCIKEDSASFTTALIKTGDEIAGIGGELRIVILCQPEELPGEWLSRLRGVRGLCVMVRADLSRFENFTIADAHSLEDHRIRLERSGLRLVLDRGGPYRGWITIVLHVAGYLSRFDEPLASPMPRVSPFQKLIRYTQKQLSTFRQLWKNGDRLDQHHKTIPA